MRRYPVFGFWGRGSYRGLWSTSGRQVFLSILFGVGLALFLVHQFNRSLRPQLITLAEAQIQNQLTLAANDAVTHALSAQELSYGDMVILHSGTEGEITTLSADTVRLNTLRTAVLAEIVEEIESLDGRTMGIPLGVLTGIDIISALGPKLPIQVISVASAEGTYRNDFSSAGINQTLHRIYLDITVTAKLLLPGSIVETVVFTPICVAETVIIGQVPQTHLNWSP